MSWRTVIISSQAKLDFKMGYMVVRGEETRRILLDEIAVVVTENPAVSITGCLIQAMIEKKIKVIFCDSQRNPSAELIPHHGGHDSITFREDQPTLSEKLLDYMELVTEFDRPKLFVTYGLRSFISDAEAKLFLDSLLRHEYHVLMIESKDHPRLPQELRYVVDEALCEIC